jgi:hypothetical protein
VKRPGGETVRVQLADLREHLRRVAFGQRVVLREPHQGLGSSEHVPGNAGNSLDEALQMAALGSSENPRDRAAGEHRRPVDEDEAGNLELPEPDDAFSRRGVNRCRRLALRLGAVFLFVQLHRESLFLGGAEASGRLARSRGFVVSQGRLHQDA